MAKSKKNVITHGLSGKVGDLVVFTQRFGKTVLGKLPNRSDKSTPEQQAARDKFKLAAKYAAACIQDPVLKALYAERAGGGVTPFNLALADFCVPPVMGEINSTHYSGAIGNTIKVQATDDTKVTEVRVSILTANGTLIEEGAALAETGSENWLYTATVVNATLAGSKIVAIAKDLPGNSTRTEKTL